MYVSGLTKLGTSLEDANLLEEKWKKKDIQQQIDNQTLLKARETVF